MEFGHRQAARQLHQIVSTDRHNKPCQGHSHFVLSQNLLSMVRAPREQKAAEDILYITSSQMK